MRRIGVTRDDVAAFLRDYEYRDNIGRYVKPYAIEPDRLGERPFAAVLPTDFLDRLRATTLTRFGDGRMWAEGDHLGIPPVTW